MTLNLGKSNLFENPFVSSEKSSEIHVHIFVFLKTIFSHINFYAVLTTTQTIPNAYSILTLS